MRKVLLVCLAAGLALVGAPSPTSAAVPVLVIEGRGFGHGVGMAQDGAYWMGRAGASTNQILGHFYPGTTLGRAGGAVRVAVLTAPGREAVLAFPNGGEVRDGRGGSQGQGFPVRVAPGGQVRVRFDGARYVAEPMQGATVSGGAAAAPSAPGDASAQRTSTSVAAGNGLTLAQEPPPTTTTTTPPLIAPPPDLTTTTTTTPPTPPDQPPPPGPGEPGGGPPPGPTPAAVSSRPLWAAPAEGGAVAVPGRGRRYRGLIEATGAGGALRLVNEVDVEQYLRGMGEVRDPRWPAASLRAQAVAARTYALRAMAVAGELCDTQRCQVYLGADAEYGAMNKAVTDTARQVVTFGRGLASTVYSANGGGFSASREEGFGTTGAGYPYLRPAPYQTQDPLPWTVRVALSDVAARFGYPGQLSSVRIGRAGPSGRAMDVVLEGSAGVRTVNGLTFDASLGLKSTLFSLTVGSSDVAPPPPPPGEGLQALPEDLTAAVAPGTASPDAVPALPSGPARVGVAPDADDAPGALLAVALLLNAVSAGAAGHRSWRARRSPATG
jgi:SpoIID/LytB domain protein